MSEHSSAGDKLAYLLIGAGIGATLALLFAPKSGREFRRDLAEVSRKGIEKGSEAAHAVRERVAESVEGARGVVERQKSSIASAIEAGKHAYREERARSDS